LDRDSRHAKYANKLAEHQCYADHNNSPPGKAIQFFSPLQMIPGWGQDPIKSAGEFSGDLAAK